MLHNFPPYRIVPGSALNTIKQVPFNMCLGTEIQYYPYTKGGICSSLLTLGSGKCSMVCFQEVDSHEYTATQADSWKDVSIRQFLPPLLHRLLNPQLH